MLYDYNILESKKASVFTLVIGNLSLGGTGKSPHAIWFINQLKELNIQTGFLSRGYGRKSKGFQMVTSETPTNISGDEAKLISNRFSHLPCAVSENRLNGIDQLIEKNPNIDVVVLDDAFQHRLLKPDFSVVIFDYKSLPSNNTLLPVGNNRDVKWRLRFCDAIIISKTPENVNEIDLTGQFKLYEKPVFISRLKYHNPFNFSEGIENKSWKSDKWLFFSGIAKPSYVEEYLTSAKIDFISKSFQDHAHFNQTALNDLQNLANQTNRKLMCTEKDWVKIVELTLENNFWIKNCFVLPVEVYFSPTQEQQLKQLLYERYHTSNQRNS